MKFKFPFQVTFGDKIPMLDIRVTNKDNGMTTNYRAMLDSGAFTLR